MQNSCLVLKQYVLSCTTHLPILCDLFTRASDVHSYNTISSDVGNLYVNKSRLSIRLNSFSVFGAKLWNCLKPDLRKLRNKPFKNKIHQFLLPVLSDEDDYCGCLVRTPGVPRSFNKSRRRCYSQDKKKTFIPELEITT